MMVNQVINISKYKCCAKEIKFQICSNESDKKFNLTLQAPYMPLPAPAYEDPATLPEVVAACDQRHCYLSCRLGELFNCFFDSLYSSNLVSVLLTHRY